MAYISALTDDDERKPAPGAPGMAPIGEPAPVAGAQPAASRFVGFGRYLAANRDAARGMVDRVAKGIEDKGAAVQQGLASAQQQMQQAAAPPTAYVDADQRAGDAPMAHDADQWAALNAQYTGPNSLSGTDGWDATQSNALAAQDEANATQSEGGLGALTGGQTSGGRRLNSALLGAAGAERFAGLRERFGKLTDGLSAANTASMAQADAARSRIAAGAAGAQAQMDAEEERKRQEQAQKIARISAAARRRY